MQHVNGGIVINIHRTVPPPTYGGQIMRTRPASDVDDIAPETCRICGRRAATEGDTCGSCAALAVPVIAGDVPPPPEIIAEGRARRLETRRRVEAYRRSRAKRHAVSGAFVFGLVGFLSACAMFCGVMVFISVEAAMDSDTLVAASGRPGSGAPGTSQRVKVLFGLSLGFAVAAVFGAPAGYALSYYGLGRSTCTLIAIGIFGLSAAAANAGNIAASDSPAVVLVLCIALGAVPGVSAGHIIGWHVAHDD